MKNNIYRFFFLISVTVTALALFFPLNGAANSIKLFSVEPFDFIYPDTKFTDQQTDKLELTMSRNEYEPLTFAILAEEDMNDVTIQIEEPATVQGNKIRNENIDVRVVKVWKQAGVNYYPGKEVLVPELLLKDDTVPIIDSWKNGIYVPPSFPESFKTRLNTGEVKQIWMTVRTNVGENPPGQYIGKIKILSENKTIRLVELSITVLPIVLPEPEKKYFIYFRGKITPNHIEFVDKEGYLKQLEDIREHGFSGVTLFEWDFDALQEAVNRVASVGFKNIVIAKMSEPPVSENIKKIREYSAEKKVEVYFYGYDEPNKDDGTLKEHIEKSKIIHAGGGKVVTAIDKASDDLLNQKTSSVYKFFPEGTYEPLDWPNYQIEYTQDYINALMKGSIKKPDRFETYYWQIYQENPSMNRLYAGFYLWKSRLDGIFPYCYQSFGQISPYNDGDVLELKGYKGKNLKIRVFNVTYPSKNGPVPTLQWEATREGVDDVRYLTRLKALLKDNIVQGVPEKVDELLKWVGYYGDQNIGVQPVKGEKFRETRRKIVELILQLQSKQ